MSTEIHGVRNGLDIRLRDAVLIRNAGFFLCEDLIVVPVPEWEGWKHMKPEIGEPSNHFARWEFCFQERKEYFWIFLRITWSSVPQIILGFLYPPDAPVLEMIAMNRRLALVDRPLFEGQPHPLSSGVIVHDIPTDLPGVLGIGAGDGAITIH